MARDFRDVGEIMDAINDQIHAIVFVLRGRGLVTPAEITFPFRGVERALGWGRLDTEWVIYAVDLGGKTAVPLTTASMELRLAAIPHLASLISAAEEEKSKARVNALAGLEAARCLYLSLTTRPDEESKP